MQNELVSALSQLATFNYDFVEIITGVEMYKKSTAHHSLQH